MFVREKERGRLLQSVPSPTYYDQALHHAVHQSVHLDEVGLPAGGDGGDFLQGWWDEQAADRE